MERAANTADQRASTGCIHRDQAAKGKPQEKWRREQQRKRVEALVDALETNKGFVFNFLCKETNTGCYFDFDCYKRKKKGIIFILN